MAKYNQEEIELARRIYDATMLVSGRATTRKIKNWTKKYGIPMPSDKMIDAIYFETARTLLTYTKQELEKGMRDAAENL